MPGIAKITNTQYRTVQHNLDQIARQARRHKPHPCGCEGSWSPTVRLTYSLSSIDMIVAKNSMLAAQEAGNAVRGIHVQSTLGIRLGYKFHILVDQDVCFWAFTRIDSSRTAFWPENAHMWTSSDGAATKPMDNASHGDNL